MPTRFRQEQPEPDAEILVVCPRCEGCAVLGPERGAPGAVPYRLTCRCGLARSLGPARYTDARRPRAGWLVLPLWLQVPCCGETLWAHHRRHLTFLEGYVRAGLRERRRNEAGAWANSSMASRLPRWLKAATNRDAVLKAIARLRAGEREGQAIAVAVLEHAPLAKRRR